MSWLSARLQKLELTGISYMTLHICVIEDYLLRYSVNLEFQNLNISCCREIKLVLKFKYSFRENYFGMLSLTKTAIIKQQLLIP